MDLSYSDEQGMLRDSVDRFIRDNYDHEKRRAAIGAPDGFSRHYWRQMAELGWLALPFAEDDGGLGGSAVDTMILMEGLGHGAIVEPVFASGILAGGVMRHGATPEQREADLPGLIDGTRIFTLAHSEPGARFRLPHVATRAERDGTGWRLSGTKTVVLHAPAADSLIVSARTGGATAEPEGISLFLIDKASEGLELQPYKTVDFLPAGDIKLDNVPVAPDALIGPESGGLPILRKAIDESIAALCAEAAGAMEFLLQQTTSYTKERVQFGQPLAKFQVLRHRMADMSICVEEAKSMALYAALHMEEPDAERSRAASTAKAKIGKGARYVSQQAVQLHGAMGVTDEMPVGDFFKRLMAFETLFGNTDWHLGRMNTA